MPLTEDGRHLRVNDSEYSSLVEALARKVRQSAWKFDIVLCLARGGLRPGDVLSRIFDKPLAVLSTSSYRAAAGTVQGRLEIAPQISCASCNIAGRVLLVDDMVDSGETLRAVVQWLAVQHPEITELRSAVIWQKAISTFVPEYVVEFLPTSPWIHQPFEKYDGMNVQDL
ncbi:MAG: phosphoribosyltransferase [Rhodocyclaceae bacterium]|nr:phosphoribosyltransferase [Rhodocyclaceae bacterium]